MKIQNELRKGNYVLHKNQILRVDVFHNNTIQQRVFLDVPDIFNPGKKTEVHPLTANFKDLKGVVLDNDWFQKLDFEQDEIGYFCLNDSIYSFVDREELGFMLVIGDVEYKETYVKYVHELQNLYYFLTKVELTLKS